MSHGHTWPPRPYKAYCPISIKSLGFQLESTHLSAEIIFSSIIILLRCNFSRAKYSPDLSKTSNQAQKTAGRRNDSARPSKLGEEMDREIGNKGGYLVTWHPDAHKRFHEQCYFFQIRCTDFTPESEQRVIKLFKNHGVSGLCVYPVFGEYDYIVRAWLSHQMLEAWLEFAKRDEIIDRVQYFPANEIDYLWRVGGASGQSSLGLIDKYMNELARIQNAPENALFKTDKDTANGLIDNVANTLYNNGIIIKIEPLKYRMINNGKIKFFVFLTAICEIEKMISAVRKVIGTNITENQGFHGICYPSLYWGQGSGGRSAVWIKAIGDDVYVIHKFVVALNEALKTNDSKSVTYIVGKRDPEESDSLSLGNTVERDAEYLLSLLRFNIIRGSDEYIKACEIVEGYPRILDDIALENRVGKYLKEWVSSVITNSEADYFIAAQKSVALEGFLRKYLIRCLEAIFKANNQGDWIHNEAFIGVLNKANIPANRRSPSNWSFMDCANIFGVLNQQYPGSWSDPLKATFGENWDSELHNFASFRNNGAHGKDEFTIVNWKRHLKPFISGLKCLNLIIEITEN